MPAIRDFLQQRLDAGEWSIGQVLVRPGISLRHIADAARAGLESFSRPEDARELAKYDDDGNYRPLKTAPNLRHGWQLTLPGAEELRQALDFLYPAALGTWLAFQRGDLAVTPLRTTLARQSGMYRVTQLVTDEQAAGLVQKTCVEGCLRERLWTIDGVASFSANPSAHFPVLCAEACNLLVAACRPVAKRNLPSAEASS
jgi:sirohydrochlorin cobaltochelatase